MRKPNVPSAIGLCVLGVLPVLAESAPASEAPPLIPADAAVQVVAEGFKFTEGPALAPDGSIYFTDIPNNRIHRYDPATGKTAVFLENTGGANGLMFLGETMFACAGTWRCVATWRKDASDSVFKDDVALDPLIADFEGKPLNSPNDLVISDGAVYFTDPRYGSRDDMAQPVEGVYFYVSSIYDGENLEPAQLVRIIDNLVRPNGIALSPDEKTLYVNDHGAKKVMAYPLLAPGKVGEGRVLYDTDTDDASGGGPDGMCVDHAGRLYVAIFEKGVVILSPEGQRLGFIDTGPRTTNCTFGADGRTLYITSDGKLKRITLHTGAPEAAPADAEQQGSPRD